MIKITQSRSSPGRLRIYSFSLVAAALVALLLMVAIPARADDPTMTPIPTPTQRYFSRAEILAQWGAKYYDEASHLNLDVPGKLPGTFGEGGSYYITFLIMAAENGSLQTFTYILVAVLVIGFLLTVIHKITGGGQYTLPSRQELADERIQNLRRERRKR